MNERSWLEKEEYDYISSISDMLLSTGCIVELGTFRGGTTELFAEKCKTSVWSVDRWGIVEEWIKAYPDYNPVEIYRRYFERKYNNVFFVVGDSVNVAKHWDKPVELLFLDADHGCDVTKFNFIEWDRNIVPGGWAVFHDTDLFPGLISDILKVYTNYENVGLVSRVHVIRKKL